MSARTKARRRALDILFEADARDSTPLVVLQEYRDRRRSNGQQDFNPYVADIVAGTTEHHDEIDRRINESAIGWTLDRMPGVDRAVLRIGVWELLWRDDIPDSVAISEAVEAVRELSTDESPAFVNGVLAAIAATGRG